VHQNDAKNQYFFMHVLSILEPSVLLVLKPNKLLPKNKKLERVINANENQRETNDGVNFKSNHLFFSLLLAQL
jgi:hypothetical protein